MGHRGQVKIVLLALLPLAAFAQDAADTLERARDKVLAAVPTTPAFTCIETIDRNYYSEYPPGPSRSCERLSIDRKNGRSHLRLDFTDRIRVTANISQGQEFYSWTGTAPASHGVEDILQHGPIGTGTLASFLLDIFRNPAVLFRLLQEKPSTLEYGFRVPVEASSFVIAGGGEWLTTGYGGSFDIARGSLSISRLTVETGELPAQTSMCEETTVVDFPNGHSVPSQGRTHAIMRDGEETDRLTTISACRESPAPTAPPPSRELSSLQPGLTLRLLLKAPIDFDTAAAGDEIFATVMDPPHLSEATVAGRIVRLEHILEHGKFQAGYLISIAFETLDNRGVISPLYARRLDEHLTDIPPVHEVRNMKLTGHGLANWPVGRFFFQTKKNAHYVVPPFQSKWLTTKEP
jgi:hypothetical protein